MRELFVAALFLFFSLLFLPSKPAFPVLVLAAPFSFILHYISSMEFATSYSIPQISISPAPPEEYRPESSSPFTSLVISVQDDGFRPTHLTPPPTSTTFKRIRSPLKPVDDPKGLADDRFAALLNSSKAYSGGKRDVDLRKEIALKAHKTKQGTCTGAVVRDRNHNCLVF